MIYTYILFGGFPVGSEGKASACNPGNPGLIPGLGRSPGEGNGNPLQYSCLENSMDGEAWWATVRGVAKSQTWLSDFTHYIYIHTHTRIYKIAILTGMRWYLIKVLIALPWWLVTLSIFYIHIYLLATWCERPTHWKRPWCWERWRAGEEGNRGWEGWIASTQWPWVWANWAMRVGSLACCTAWGCKEVRHDWTIPIGHFMCLEKWLLKSLAHLLIRLLVVLLLSCRPLPCFRI